MTITISIIVSVVLALGTISLILAENSEREFRRQARVEWSNLRSKLERERN